MTILCNTGLTGILTSMLLACSALAKDIVSNPPTKTGFRLDTTALPPSPFDVRLTPPRLLPPASLGIIPGFLPKTNAVRSASNGYYQSDEMFPFSDLIETVSTGPEPIRTASPSLKEFSLPRYQPTSITNVQYRHMDSIARPAPVQPDNPNLTLSGTGPLRLVLGEMEYAYVSGALDGICGDDENVAFEREGGRTALTFKNGLRIIVDDITGEIQMPPGLPAVSDAELADLTWARMESSGAIAKWRSRYQETDGNGIISRRLSEIRLDEVFRVSDKAFVAWRLLPDPPSFGGSFSRIVFWIDVPSRSIVSEGSEISFRPRVPQSRTEFHHPEPE